MIISPEGESMNVAKSFLIVFCALCMQWSDQAYAYRFVVCGDCRAPGADWLTHKPFPQNIFNQPVIDYVASQIVALNPRPAMVMFLGDGVINALPDAQGHPVPYTGNLAYWKAYMETVFQGIPFYVTVGNEDLNDNFVPTLANQQAFAATFNNMPDNGPIDPVDLTHLAYSFEDGQGKEKCLFVVFDSFAWYSDPVVYTTPVYTNDNVDPLPHDIDEDDPLDYKQEQIDWFSSVAAASTANHKFVFTHGPTFVPVGGQLISVGSNMSRMWDIALNNNFDTYFCAHEHLFYRWNVTRNAYPTAVRTMIQSLTGTIGAPLISSSGVNANPENRIYFGFNYVVVDVDGDMVTERAYTVYQKSTGGYSQELFDTTVVMK
jgi:hypothetical protein